MTLSASLHHWLTAIRPWAPPHATAFTLAPCIAPPRALDLERSLANFVLAEAETARHAGRCLHGVNFINLGLCVTFFLATCELTLTAPTAVFESGVGLWCVLEFLPVTLVFAGAHRLKHLKSLPWVGAGVLCMFYLTLQRGLLAWLLLHLAPLQPGVSLPILPFALVCLLATALNATTLAMVLRLLARSEFRCALR